ncbi:hypothetical protein SAY87_015372 [Trapa incisa]|uniref:Pentatricopeptide repeat-containing protein n=1 Tax=Trapa incisa TaxID=236973 RepID=A0AAN7GQ23_9MYRT|nr:hypothetical protein SAY87_015372 [Trapa incisa]
MISTTAATASSLPPHHLHPSSADQQKAALDLLNSKLCGSSVHHLKQAHALVLKMGQFQDHYVAGTLVKCYANPQFKSLELALKVVDSVQNPNVFVWNNIIRGCLGNDEPLEALQMYYEMVDSDTRPNKFTFPAILKACSNAGAQGEGLQVHAQIVKRGFLHDLHHMLLQASNHIVISSWTAHFGLEASSVGSYLGLLNVTI